MAFGLGEIRSDYDFLNVPGYYVPKGALFFEEMLFGLLVAASAAILVSNR